MIVTMVYQFHDHQPTVMALDTEKLDVAHLFEQDLRQALESEKDSVRLEGDKYNDEWGDLEKARVHLPAKVDRVKNIRVYFDC